MKTSRQLNNSSIAVNALDAVIRCYQRTLSPDHGMFRYVRPARGCRFFPSCSEYACQALHQYGLLRGSVVSVGRLVRCHPWHAGGYDPLAAPKHQQ